MRPPVLGQMFQPLKRYHVWYVVALAPPARVVELGEWCRVEARRRAAVAAYVECRWYVLQCRSGGLRRRSGQSHERWYGHGGLELEDVGRGADRSQSDLPGAQQCPANGSPHFRTDSIECALGRSRA